MAQRDSGYPRQADELYETPKWVAKVVAPWLRVQSVREIWEPAAGPGRLAAALWEEGFLVHATSANFFTTEKIPAVDAIVTNPPYGRSRNGNVAAAFVRTALGMRIPIVAMLMPVDFDSGKTRQDIFRHCSAFIGKIVLLDRIVFFQRPGAAPSTNHAWFLWGHGRRQMRPWIAYGLENGEEDASQIWIGSGDSQSEHFGDGPLGPAPAPSHRGRAK